MQKTRHVYELLRPVYILGEAAVAGPKEGEGPLGSCFQMVTVDDMLQQKSYEKAECIMMERAIDLALAEAVVSNEEVSFMLAGDLLNQIITANFTARFTKIPFLGLYGACSTMAETLLLGSLLLSGGYGRYALCATSSHFSTAERQYRQPLEMGIQRPPFSQWTVTAAGAAVLGVQGTHQPRVTHVCVGEVIDLGITDPNNMGAAMAPAAAHTLLTFFTESGFRPEDFDYIITGDLGTVGSDLLRQLLQEHSLELGQRHFDCGVEIFRGVEGTHAGGSGCGCSASVLNGYFLPRMARREIHRLLFAATGALLSPTTTLQKESIPGICQAVVIEEGAAC